MVSTILNRPDAVSPPQTQPRRRATRSGSASAKHSSPADRCRRRFLRFFPEGFRDSTYLAWERDYKTEAHLRWGAELGRAQFRALLHTRRFDEIAARAI